ncbi:NnrS family protein [Thalassotalea euphylliae]|nr:NnrS family protein [Thalassotalea euphylliae]
MMISEPLVNAENNTSALSIFNDRHPLWQLSFRAFFLAASLFSVVAVALWVGSLSGLSFASPITAKALYLSSLVWHAHEMIFGFAATVAIGFILTAVQTWTSSPSISGRPVMALVAIWVMVRALLWYNTISSLAFAIALQSLWWLAIIGCYARIVLRAKNKRNYLFIPLLSALATVNLLVLGCGLAGKTDLAVHFTRSAVLIFTLVMAVVGGRVIPFFTVRGAGTEPTQPLPWLEMALLPVAIAGITIFILGQFISLPITPALFMLSAGILHLVRCARWSGRKTLNVPLLWSLHLAYLLMSLGLIALGLSYLTPMVQFSAALHIITIGAIGLIIIAMMSRVSLGHTGRALITKRRINLAFYLVAAAALIRFILPHLGYTLLSWQLSALLWGIAFSLFFFTYWPILTKPRQ